MEDFFFRLPLFPSYCGGPLYLGERCHTCEVSGDNDGFLPIFVETLHSRHHSRTLQGVEEVNLQLHHLQRADGKQGQRGQTQTVPLQPIRRRTLSAHSSPARKATRKANSALSNRRGNRPLKKHIFYVCLPLHTYWTERRKRSRGTSLLLSMCVPI